MNRRKEWRSLAYGEKTGATAWLNRVLSYIATLALLCFALMFSFVVFAILAVLGVVVGAWFWWKTRALRRELERAGQTWQESQDFRPANEQNEGVVIEGDARRVDEEAVLLSNQNEPE